MKRNQITINVLLLATLLVSGCNKGSKTEAEQKAEADFVKAEAARLKAQAAVDSADAANRENRELRMALARHQAEADDLYFALSEMQRRQFAPKYPPGGHLRSNPRPVNTTRLVLIKKPPNIPVLKNRPFKPPVVVKRPIGRTVGPGGGIVPSPGSAATLFVPKGALRTNVPISINRIALPSSKMGAFCAVELLPAGTRFAPGKPAQITIPLGRTFPIAKKLNVLIFRPNKGGGGSFENANILATVIRPGNLATALLPHFTIYALTEMPVPIKGPRNEEEFLRDERNRALALEQA
jgi:hypothetical protein